MALGASGVPARVGRSGRAVDRAVRLIAGGAICGAGYALTVQAELGLGPWHVVQQGFAERTGITIGTGAIVVSVALLVAAMCLRERPGVGTVSAIFVTGVSLDFVLTLIESPEGLVVRFAMMLGGLAVMTFGGALIISASLGAHPLDSLMTGIYRRVPFTLYQVRIGLEVFGLALGALAGGSVGIGSAVIGLGVGPFLHGWLHVLSAVPEKLVREQAASEPGLASAAPAFSPDVP